NVSVPPALSVVASLAPPDSTAPFAPPSQPPQQRCMPLTSTLITGSVMPAHTNPAIARIATPTLIIPTSCSPRLRPRPDAGASIHYVQYDRSAAAGVGILVIRDRFRAIDATETRRRREEGPSVS